MALPANTREVGVDHLFDALATLGCPTAFLDADRDAPDERDLPQLAGALVSAVERLIIAQQLIVTPPQPQQFAAGYLGSIGAQNGLCGAARGFDMITVRLQATEMLLEGFQGVTPPVQLTRLALAAAVRFAVVACTGQAITAGTMADDDETAARARAAFRIAVDSLKTALLIADEMSETTDLGGR